MLRRLSLVVTILCWIQVSCVLAEDWGMKLQFQEETATGTGRFHRVSRDEQWDPKETAIIVCDVWDFHHCLNAVQRLNQFAPRLNEVLNQARLDGATIVHSPSDCMPAYEGHPARIRATQTPVAKNLPPLMPHWCSVIPGEEKGDYPIDQSDGGEDDDPTEHAQWAAKLTAMGRNAGTPWQRQSAHIQIDEERDFISDRGDEVWNVLEARGIKNVILAGVHVNMCVLGRPFGLRQMARNNKNVVLLRDMTDSMYNPKRWPYVSHYTGNDLIISHIERHVSPTVTSDQIIGGSPFSFHDDRRPHLVILCAEDEYQTEHTLPVFAQQYLGRNFRVSYVWGNPVNRNSLPGLEILESADALLVSVRRRLLPEKDMTVLRRFVAAGKPVIGIRTASHAFCLRKGDVPEGLADWPEFDAEVLGGSYTNHHGNSMIATAFHPQATTHSIMTKISTAEFPLGGSLYMAAPLMDGAQAVLMGRVEGESAEPVAWTFLRRDGGRSFYTSLGHIDDFSNPVFLRLLGQGITWATKTALDPEVFEERADHWSTTQVPDEHRPGPVWYRCVVRLGEGGDAAIKLHGGYSAWLNGTAVGRDGVISKTAAVANDANLLVIRTTHGLTSTPTLEANGANISLQGRWQFRAGDDPQWSNIPLPAKFGAGSDIIFK
jgi:nicotinamidase-related amidase/type 1 glutamine amidotransferase